MKALLTASGFAPGRFGADQRPQEYLRFARHAIELICLKPGDILGQKTHSQN